VVEAHPDVARDDPLGRGGVAAQVAMEGAEPEAVVRQLGDLVGDDPVEAQRVLGQRQALERAVGPVEDRRRGRGISQCRIGESLLTSSEGRRDDVVGVPQHQGGDMKARRLDHHAMAPNRRRYLAAAALVRGLTLQLAAPASISAHSFGSNR
jgi:hypothetical protein